MQDPLTPSLTSWRFPPVSLKRMALQRRIHPWCFADFHGQLEKPFKLYNVYQTERSVFNMVATTRGFWNFPNFPWPTELTISHISPENELSPSFTAILFTHLLMLSASHVQCTWIDCSLPKHAKRIQLVVQFHEKYSTNTTWFMSAQCTKEFWMSENNKSRGKTLNIYSFVDVFQRLKFSLTFPWPWRNFFPNHFLTFHNHV